MTTVVTAIAVVWGLIFSALCLKLLLLKPRTVTSDIDFIPRREEPRLLICVTAHLSSGSKVNVLFPFDESEIHRIMACCLEALEMDIQATKRRIPKEIKEMACDLNTGLNPPN